jgi:PAS domain S-box-containing protein
VGIVASSSDIPILTSFFDTLPADSGIAFVVVSKSARVTQQMLSRHTEMPVHIAAETARLQRNSVYLIPPRRQMAVAHGRLLGVNGDCRKQRTPAEASFFRTLGQDFRERALGIMLPGTLRQASQQLAAMEMLLPREERGAERSSQDALLVSDRGRFFLPVATMVEALLEFAHCRSGSGAAARRQAESPLPWDRFSLEPDWESRSTSSRVPDARTVSEREHLCQTCPRERALAAANAQLAGVLDAATQISIIATDVDGMITVFNSGAQVMLGYTAAEMVGKRTPEVIHLPSEVEQRGQELTREFGRAIHGFEVFVAYAKSGRFDRREWTYVHKDGRHLTVNLVVTAVRDPEGKITGFLGVAEDISKRKLSDDALRKSEERFDLAVAGSNDGIWDWDVRTNEVYYAPRFKQLLGYRDEEFEDRFASFERALHPDDRARTLASVHRHLHDREPYDVECRLLTRSGEYRWFRARGQAVWSDSDQPVRMAGSLTDITQRKRTEEALARNAAEIQRANETLRIAEAEARKAVNERDQFLAMLSHELRNPLSAILSGVGILDHAGADHASVEQARQAIGRQVDHMSRLLDDLLDVARVTQGKISFRKRIIDLSGLLREAADGVRPQIDARRHQLAIMTPAEPVPVEGDATRLLQIVGNLLTNAAKYSPPQGEIEIELSEQGSECELRVRDNGRGIDPAHLDEIFDMFFQSNRGLDRSDGGMGVGLTLVRSLVEMHHGTVTAHSDGPGRGSEFVVRLPLASKLAPSSSRPAALPARPGTRVVLVEDNPDSREMLRTLLTLEKFQVDVADDGEQGLNKILEQRPDFAVIDIGLPKLDGYEVARRVRQAGGTRDIYLIALTGYGQQKDREAVFQAGFDEHLVKPVNLVELKRVLSERQDPDGSHRQTDRKAPARISAAKRA